ncbi:MAG TPA: hypothetical protein VJ787_00570 [Thermoleophilia bacterium]|nr:hypothetical protein [Thermoleophilia bacterium]
MDLPLERAQEGWKAFTQWVLVGNYRLLCDQWSCERMAEQETVSFSFLDAHHSRVTVHFDFDDDPAPDPTPKVVRVASRLTQDLQRFREFVEQGQGRHKHRSAGVKADIDREDHAGRLRLTSDSLIERDHDDLYGSPHYQS